VTGRACYYPERSFSGVTGGGKLMEKCLIVDHLKTAVNTKVVL